ncbi:hypothetical protein UR09_03280 [Candidatus Nitromaritima sp. SCGC AAA799-A02]|nr:hypothetical protein UR09_03280 [Candidatus Nitromaritima sp. SCGC AAA799-A02]
MIFIFSSENIKASSIKEIEGMVFLQADCFDMGSEEFVVEEPIHKVCLTDFYIGVYEVTQKQFEEVMGYNPSFFKGKLNPVENVTWPEAENYCRKKGWRLPTEAEWEYAARSGSEKPYHWGWDMDPAYGWYKDNSGNAPHSAGQKKPNVFGLHDTSGNVWEWVSDWYREDYYELSAKSEPDQNPLGPTSGQFLIIRGGSFEDDPFFLRSASRYWYEPLVKSRSIGFRCAVNASDVKERAG